MDKHNGLLVIDKPKGLTSRDVVNQVQKWFPRGTRLGHTGTLDPLATGVLVLAVGVATRLTEFIQDMEKVYEAEILLGASSTTDDAEGSITQVPGAVPPTEETLRGELARMVGEIDQVPPSYSAAKVAGRRAYDLARKGAEVTLAERKVHIYAIHLLRYEYPHLHLEVRCGKGTYIRSLARDLGQRLGCGGLITVLRRLRVGTFTPDQAVVLEAEDTRDHPQLLPLSLAVSQLAAVHLETQELQQLRQGQSIPCSQPPVSQPVAIFDNEDRLVGIVEFCQGRLKPTRMLNY